MKIYNLDKDLIYEDRCTSIKRTLECAVRKGSNLSYSDLSNSDLSNSDLRGSNLRGSNLRDSNLSYSDLSKVVGLEFASIRLYDLMQAGIIPENFLKELFPKNKGVVIKQLTERQFI